MSTTETSRSRDTLAPTSQFFTVDYVVPTKFSKAPLNEQTVAYKNLSAPCHYYFCWQSIKVSSFQGPY
jgi:hypothetical protein